jgi:hypothetical protein
VLNKKPNKLFATKFSAGFLLPKLYHINIELNGIAIFDIGQ